MVKIHSGDGYTDAAAPKIILPGDEEYKASDGFLTGAGGYRGAWSRYGRLDLYNRGNECTDITGGWMHLDTWGGGGVGPYAKNSDHLYIKAGTWGTGHWPFSSFITTNPVDLSKYKRIVINGEFALNKNVDMRLMTTTTTDTDYNNNFADKRVDAGGIDNRNSFTIYNTITLSLSNKATPLYVCISLCNCDPSNNNITYLKVYECYLER